MIRGILPSEPNRGELLPLHPAKRSTSNTVCESTDPAQIVVAPDEQTVPPMVVVGVNCLDRPGLLHDISKCLFSLRLQCHHSEASVIGLRSVSVWRCEILDNGVADEEEIWTVLNVSKCHKIDDGKQIALPLSEL